MPAASASRTATVAGQQIPIGPLSIIGPVFENTYHPTAALDITPSGRDQVRLRWTHTAIDSISTTAVSLPEFYTPVVLRNHLASASYFRSITPTLLNELRFGWNRGVTDYPIGDHNFPGLDTLPNITFNDLGLIVGPNSFYPQSNRSNTYQLANNLTWTAGAHTFKFGYDGRKVNSTNFFVQRFRRLRL